MKGESEKFSSMWWKDLCLSCGEGDVSSWVNRSFVWKLGEGDQARFWLDNWGSEECFASKFQRLFGLSLQQFEVVKKLVLSFVYCMKFFVVFFSFLFKFCARLNG